VGLKRYEIMLILPPDAEEGTVGGVSDRIAAVLSESGGEITKVDRWGKRRLAYEIGHFSEGTYLIVECTADKGALKELDRVLGLADEVVRFKVMARAA
jgi:small subunit ribosomal protein S6